MVVNMCGSLDAAKEASRGGNTKRLSHHTETSGCEALLHEIDKDDLDDDEQQLFETLVNRLSRKKVAGNRPASETLRAAVLSMSSALNSVFQQLATSSQKMQQFNGTWQLPKHFQPAGKKSEGHQTIAGWLLDSWPIIGTCKQSWWPCDVFLCRSEQDAKDWCAVRAHTGGLQRSTSATKIKRSDEVLHT